MKATMLSTTRAISLSNRAILMFLVSFVFFSPTPAFARGPAKPESKIPAASELINRAWNALDEEMRIEDIDAALEYFEKALVLDPANADLLAELSQEYFLRAGLMPDKNPMEIRAREKWHKKGIDAAKSSLAIKETAAGHYWYASNLAASVKRKSVYIQIKAFPDIRSHMLWVDINKNDYRYGAVPFFWCRLISESPEEAINIIGEDPEQIVQEMEKAINAEPRFIQNHLYMAMFYESRGKREKALEILEKAISIDPVSLAREKAHNRYALRLSKEMWKKLTGRDYPER